MKIHTLAISALIFILLATFYNQKQTPFKHLDGILKIYRDQKGVPHILADSKQNLFYGIGYAEAQDRLWSLHFKRMIFLGRSAEMFGPEVIPLDKYTRNLNIKQVGRRNANITDPETRRLLQIYCDGINDYVKASKLLPLQFYLFWTNWEDWTIEDSNSMLAFFSFNLEFDWMYELARERLKQTVGWRLAMKLIPSSTADMFRETTIIKDDQLKQQGRYKKYNQDDYLKIVQEHWKNLMVSMNSPTIPDLKQTNFGSNAWVVGGKHTSTGKPILANDPHLGLVIPSLFYPLQIIIVDSKGNIVKQAFGAKNDGMPGLSLGVNHKFAWGATALYADGKDVYIETIRNVSNGNKEYLLDGEWKSLNKREQSFYVRGLGQIKQTYFDTHRGPLMTALFLDVHLKYGFPLPQHYENAISLSAVSFHPDGETFKGLLNLAFSETQQQFVQAGTLLKNVNIDSGFITSEGIFGYGAIGRISKRNIPEMGSFVKNGSTSIYDFLDYYTYPELPILMNPERGYITMTNNKFASDNFDLRGSLHQPSNARALRIETLLKEQIQSGKKFTIEDMMKFQQDDVDAYLSIIKDKWVSILQKHKLEWRDSEFGSRILNIIKNWNCSFNRDLIEPAVYSIWEHQFQTLLLQNKGLTESERVSITNHAYFNSYYFKLIERLGDDETPTQDDMHVCENNLTKQMNLNPCVSNMIIAFNKLEKSLFDWFGTLKQQEWKWGVIHKTHFTFVPWTEIPLIEKIWGRKIPSSGNSQTLNVGIHSFQKKNFDSFGSAVFRMITDIDTTYYSVNTGTSDRVRSPFYDNFAKDFYDGKYEKYSRINPLKDAHGWSEMNFGKQ